MPDFKKMSIDDLVNLDLLDFNKMTAKEMRQVVGRLRDAGNKKIRRLEKTGYSTPALRQVYKSGGLFTTRKMTEEDGKITVRPMTLNELRSEYMRATSFIGNKTSTMTGYKTVLETTSTELANKGINVAPENVDTFFRVFEELKKNDPNAKLSKIKYEIQKSLEQVIDYQNPDKAIEIMKTKVQEIYESHQRTEQNFDGVSKFFEQK